MSHTHCTSRAFELVKGLCLLFCLSALSLPQALSQPGGDGSISSGEETILSDDELAQILAEESVVLDQAAQGPSAEEIAAEKATAEKAAAEKAAAEKAAAEPAKAEPAPAQ